MSAPPSSKPDRDARVGSSAPGPTWAADMAEAPATLEPRLPPGQMALFSPDDLAPAPPRPRGRRLPGPIKALLTAIEVPMQRLPRPTSASWPDSFFDVVPDA